MTARDFSGFFGKATAGKTPYEYQQRLAAEPCISRLIDVPTGLGKTAAAIVAWLWNRAHKQDPAWPRRLVYCLPMRTLVEQTRDEARTWVERLHAAGLIPTKPRVVVLMGGEEIDPEAKDWDIHPEDNAILIGTQDMLLSRALNRGYGMSRYRWPMHFGLLNNDCLWVMDEVQLMGAGLAATTQLEGFRQTADLSAPNSHSWWMSATMAPDWLATVDFPRVLLEQATIQLTTDKGTPRVESLRSAPKAIVRAPLSQGGFDEKKSAAFVRDHCSPGGLNLVVVNTVRRARNLHKAIAKALHPNLPSPLLLHSQFRPEDRLRVLEAVRHAPPGSVVVATQVIEAGVDLSCHTLFTELAPWSSLVQRFGRCNRWLKPNGQPHFPDAKIYWFDLDPEKQAAPYEPEQLVAAREILSVLNSAALKDIEATQPTAADRPRFRHVLRRKDLVELFDTTPDLAGADLDIDRFIRDSDQSHVSVFWRNWSGHTPNGGDGKTPEPGPQRPELCPTGIADLKSLIGKGDVAWRWDVLDRRWFPCKESEILPGQTYLLHASQGGYDAGHASRLPLGWTGDAKSPVKPIPPPQPPSPAEFNEADPQSELGAWQTIAEHTGSVCEEVGRITTALATDLSRLTPRCPHWLQALAAAARWHDWGKAHPAFQATLKPESLAAAALSGPAAKAPSAAWRQGRLPDKPSPGEARRRHFRHELASALGLLHPDSGFTLTDPLARDLAAYLVAAHHGKVRLSIRSLPGEWIPASSDTLPDNCRFARGVWDGDALPATDLGGGIHAPSIALSLELMELGLCEQPPFTGQPSWVERIIILRDTLGPFVLAYLETLLRAADQRASSLTEISE